MTASDSAAPQDLAKRIADVLARHHAPKAALPNLLPTIRAMIATRDLPARRPLPAALRDYPDEDRKMAEALATVARIAKAKADRLRRDRAHLDAIGPDWPKWVDHQLHSLELLASYTARHQPPPGLIPTPRRGIPPGQLRSDARCLASAVRFAYSGAGEKPPGFNGEKTIGAKLVRDLLAIVEGTPRTLVGIRAALRGSKSI